MTGIRTRKQKGKDGQTNSEKARTVGDINLSQAQNGLYAQTSMGFHLPITTDRTVAIRSQFFLSKPLKFTPRRSLLPIMSVLCGVAFFLPQERSISNGGDTEESRCSVYGMQTTQGIDGGAASLYR